MKTIWKTLHSIAVLLAAWAPVGAGELSGTLSLAGDERAGDAAKAVIWFVPEAGVKSPAVPAESFRIVTQRKDFQPHVLAVPVGSTVAFPNEDRILHNAFSVSGENRFDVGLYRGGESKETTFKAPGVVQVFCNVHHSMAAYVVVLETPYYTSPTRSGEFRLTGLPDGAGTLHVWHERTDTLTRRITLPASGPLELELEVTRKRVPRHRNKFGKPYARRGRDY